MKVSFLSMYNIEIKAAGTIKKYTIFEMHQIGYVKMHTYVHI